MTYKRNEPLFTFVGAVLSMGAVLLLGRCQQLHSAVWNASWLLHWSHVDSVERLPAMCDLLFTLNPVTWLQQLHPAV